MCTNKKHPKLLVFFSNAWKRVKPPSALYSFLQCLKHLKENVELTFHHCQIMLAEYGYFSHCKLACGDAAFKDSFLSSHFTAQMMEIHVYHAFKCYIGCSNKMVDAEIIAVNVNGCYITSINVINGACSPCCGRNTFAMMCTNNLHLYKVMLHFPQLKVY